MGEVTKNKLQSLFITGLIIGLGRKEPKYETAAWRNYNNRVLEGDEPWPTPIKAQIDGQMFGETLREIEKILKTEAASSKKRAKRTKR